MRHQLVFIPVVALACAVLTVGLHAQTAAQSAARASQIGANLGIQGNGAAKQSGASGLMVAPEDFSKLKIAPGFLLDVQVYDEPDLSVQLRVDDSGDVIMPLVGAIHVAGNTQTEAQQKIQSLLKTQNILNNPQVTLNIAQYVPTNVTILGEVHSPGRLQMLAPHSLLDVLSFAGGETALAGGEIQVRHTQSGETVTTTYHYGRNSNGNTISGVTVFDGDTVIVPQAGIVYVLGAVNRPGGYLMQEDGKLDTAQALSLAMGTDVLAKTGGLHIIRRKPDGSFVEFKVSYKDMTEGKIAPPQLQAQDIVYVPMSAVKNVLSHLTSVLSAASAAAIYTTR